MEHYGGYIIPPKSDIHSPLDDDVNGNGVGLSTEAGEVMKEVDEVEETGVEVEKEEDGVGSKRGCQRGW